MTGHTEFSAVERVPFASGESFGNVGRYERLTGKVTFTFDPKCERDQKIVDLALAPADEDGLVKCRADFCILKPMDLAAGNRRLLFEFVNRGNKRILQFFNDAPPGNMPIGSADAGNGFLFRQGYTVVWLGWQGDLWPGDDRAVLEVPVVRMADRNITGEVFAEFVASSKGVKVFPLSAATTARSYSAASR